APPDVLDDSAEQEEHYGEGEHAEADDLALRALAITTCRSLEPADADDLEQEEGGREHHGDRYPVRRELDWARPKRPVLPQQDEGRDSAEVREDVADIARGEDAEDVADEEDEQDVDDHVERHRVSGHAESVQSP